MNNAQLIITIIKWILIVFIMIEAYTAVSVIFDKKNKISVMAKGTINLALGKSNSIYLNADKITADMSKYGVMYMFRDYNMDPSAFVSAKLACAGGFGLLGFIAAPNEWIPKIIGITIGLILGFIAPDIFIRISNRQDNDKMMTDIQTIYTTLKIHARAGVYVTDSLIECQRNIENGHGSDLDAVQMNADAAAHMGIADGEIVELVSDMGRDHVRVETTPYLHPACIFTSAAPGGRSFGADAGGAQALGVGPLDHTPLRWDPLTGAALTQENAVRVEKIAAREDNDD